MGKKILFPFLFDKDFHRGYSWTMELAVRMDAKLSFFTVVPPDQTSDEGAVQRIYHALLEAGGSYIQFFNKPNKPIARTERFIENGDFTFSLKNLIRANRFDIIVVDPSASLLSPDVLNDVLEHANGVIVLPGYKGELSHPAGAEREIEQRITDNFFDLLRQSDTYKLPVNFFRTLGRDQKLFNYLRRIFKKSNDTTPGRQN